MTGIQALERIARMLPMKPGKVERREFGVSPPRHADPDRRFDVTIGKVAGVIGDTRTEQDFARFLDTLLSSAANTRWDIVCDNLNIHLSESRRSPCCAALRASTATSASKVKSGVLASKATFAKHYGARKTIASSSTSPPSTHHGSIRRIGNLVFHSGTKAHPPRQLRQQTNVEDQDRAVHHLFPQRHHGQALPLDLMQGKARSPDQHSPASQK